MSNKLIDYVQDSNNFMKPKLNMIAHYCQGIHWQEDALSGLQEIDTTRTTIVSSVDIDNLLITYLIFILLSKKRYNILILYPALHRAKILFLSLENILQEIAPNDFHSRNSIDDFFIQMGSNKVQFGTVENLDKHRDRRPNEVILVDFTLLGKEIIDQSLQTFVLSGVDQVRRFILATEPNNNDIYAHYKNEFDNDHNTMKCSVVELHTSLLSQYELSEDEKLSQDEIKSDINETDIKDQLVAPVPPKVPKEVKEAIKASEEELKKIQQLYEAKQEFIKELEKMTMHGAKRNVHQAKSKITEEKQVTQTRSSFKIDKNKPFNKIDSITFNRNKNR